MITHFVPAVEKVDFFNCPNYPAFYSKVKGTNGEFYNVILAF